MTLRALPLLLCLPFFGLACQSQVKSRGSETLPALNQQEGRRSRVHTNLPAAPKSLIAELDRAHELVDKLVPSLKDDKKHDALLLAGPGVYEKYARNHGVDPAQPAFSGFSTAALVVEARSLPINYLESDQALNGLGKSPQGAPFSLYEALFYQRYESQAPEARSVRWIERAHAVYFSYQSVLTSQSREEAKRFLRERLADEYFSIMMGGPRDRLQSLLDAIPERRQSSRRVGKSRIPTSQGPVPLAAACFLYEPFEPLPANLAENLLLAQEKDFETLRKSLTALSGRYESYVRDRYIGELLDTIENDKALLERQLAEAALLMAIGRKLRIAKKPLAQRRVAIQSLKADLAKSAPPIRLLDQYQVWIQKIVKSRRSRKVFDQFLQEINRELKRREGYSNDALEAGRRSLPKSIEAEIKRLR